MAQPSATITGLFRTSLDALQREAQIVLLASIAYGLIASILSSPFWALFQVVLAGEGSQSAPSGQPALVEAGLAQVALAAVGQIATQLLFILFCIPWARIANRSPFAPLEGGARFMLQLAWRILGQVLAVYVLAAFAVMAFVSLTAFVAPFFGDYVASLVGIGLAVWIILSATAVTYVLISLQSYGRVTEIREAFELIKDQGRIITGLLAGYSLITLFIYFFGISILAKILPVSIINRIDGIVSLSLGLIFAFALMAALEGVPQFQALKRKVPLV